MGTYMGKAWNIMGIFMDSFGENYGNYWEGMGKYGFLVEYDEKMIFGNYPVIQIEPDSAPSPDK